MDAERTVTTRSDEAMKDRPFDLRPSDLLTMYRFMVLARTLDERCWLLNRQGRAPFVISCQGHEACQVGSAMALRRGTDWVHPYYRDLGVVLVMGLRPVDVLLGLLGRAGDPCSGSRQMPFHYSQPELRLLPCSSPVATQIPQAAGVALASRARGEDAVTVVYFGEGAASKGDFHEGVNFAAIHRLPVVFFCENNGWAISVPRHKQMAVPNVADRAAAYGIPGVVVDGLDPVATYEVTRQAVERARRGEGPTLVEAKVERLVPHSSDDDDRTYRPPEDVARARERDPIPRFRDILRRAGVLDEQSDRALREEATRDVDEALAAAERAEYPGVVEAETHVYAG
ncbi:MAG TPA: thiamine pyrophosphate-dependent dehydrogenase E1 component subunit alpha [Chloroflexota bacterium]